MEKMNFVNWLIHQKKISEYSAKRYSAVLEKRILEWLPSYELPKNSIEFEALKRMILSLDIYQERNRIGNNMYSSALNHYGHYLKENNIHDSEVFNKDQSFTTEAEKRVKVRLLQNKFRKGLFDLHQSCVVTGFSNSQFLIASHIKPWAKSTNEEKIDPYNGLLLTPNFDKLFDKNLISIDFKGNVLKSKILQPSDIQFFQLPKKVSFIFDSRHKKYLDYHNALVEVG